MSTQVSAAVGTNSAPESVVRRIYKRAAQLDRVGMGLLRWGLIVVLFWIGGLKFAGAFLGRARGPEVRNEFTRA